MNYNTYEVLLGRDNGYNKTVHVHDCMYEDEARLLAESQYGLPALRVLYQGRTAQQRTQDELAPPYYQPRGSLWSGLAVPSVLLGLVGVVLVVEFWWVFLLGAGGVAGYKAYRDRPNLGKDTTEYEEEDEEEMTLDEYLNSI